MMKKYLLVLPEFILLGLSSYWFLDNFMGGNHFNPFAFGVFIILLLQVFLKNKYVGFLLAWLISLFSLYLVLAVISEFRDFPNATVEAVQLLTVGLLFCSLGFGSAVLMFWRYFPKVFPAIF
jgi:VIT1/CCC1 family predicted Fe2+/Mn2+ transporter